MDHGAEQEIELGCYKQASRICPPRWYKKLIEMQHEKSLLKVYMEEEYRWFKMVIQMREKRSFIKIPISLMDIFHQTLEIIEKHTGPTITKYLSWANFNLSLTKFINWGEECKLVLFRESIILARLYVLLSHIKDSFWGRLKEAIRKHGSVATKSNAQTIASQRGSSVAFHESMMNMKRIDFGMFCIMPKSTNLEREWVNVLINQEFIPIFLEVQSFSFSFAVEKKINPEPLQRDTVIQEDFQFPSLDEWQHGTPWPFNSNSNHGGSNGNVSINSHHGGSNGNVSVNEGKVGEEDMIEFSFGPEESFDEECHLILEPADGIPANPTPEPVSEPVVEDPIDVDEVEKQNLQEVHSQLVDNTDLLEADPTEDRLWLAAFIADRDRISTEIYERMFDMMKALDESIEGEARKRLKKSATTSSALRPLQRSPRGGEGGGATHVKHLMERKVFASRKS
ncbi:hypothetical protein H6P81_016350 [Aristolochia fimbriata]|uniref:Uncharacterized protein n=1 Tax=Aristolochia fimbriata TaxID=158543 RepID=A0AAV7E809_ARIFI|nr:hypothetical protein H6P81_016350 [Aristolochia fimbriata]